MSRACPDDSLLSDEILVACTDRILASLDSSAAQETSELASGPTPPTGH